MKIFKLILRIISVLSGTLITMGMLMQFSEISVNLNGSHGVASAIGTILGFLFAILTGIVFIWLGIKSSNKEEE